ncbi:hypothetical protein CC78DRAFT_513128 [Lojkania enalia]|uniref:Uncharacterized protein n=1 Tax=Lojkania enalia TaxID=147567 RepID=A0A9P4KDZ7_9PLEO|nr:hypothetical protein CC78DRAFT_513128 [Didymosphaeria enalia]
MKPSTLYVRAVRSRPMCQSCEHMLQRPPAHRSLIIAAPSTRTSPRVPSMRRQPATLHSLPPTLPTRHIATTRRAQRHAPEIDVSPAHVDELNAQLKEAEEHMHAVFSSSKVEPEETILQILDELEQIGRATIGLRSGRKPATFSVHQSSASAILSIASDGPASKNKSPEKTPMSKHLPTPAYLSRLAEDLLKHKQVFISPAILSKYVSLQWLLERPHSIPEIFHLYANKPVPELGSSPPKYLKPNPKGAKQAIPKDVAEKALSAAIDAKSMPLAIEVLQTTYCAPAWRRRKLLTKVGPPSMVAAILPFGIYALAQEASLYSGYLDPWLFKMYTFAGISTYILCTGTLGYTALTTHNDHHDRVVWIPGTRLFERWMREEERAALDRIACAWGFKEDWKRGDEEGEDWEGLREWCFMKGMWLDKPDLMPGMNTRR